MNTISHKHRFDSQGKQICCTQEEKVHREADAKTNHNHDINQSHDDHNHENHEKKAMPFNHSNLYISILVFVTALVIDQLEMRIFNSNFRIILYGFSYLLVAIPVFKEAFAAFRQGIFFNEFSLMSLATAGAMAIGEYPEAAAVMIFYSVGELFQTLAVSRAKASIKSLLSLRSTEATVNRSGDFISVGPEDVKIGETIQVRNGESVPLDGILESKIGQFNTAALTGESVPKTLQNGGTVLAGMINQGGVVEIKVEKLYSNSSISKILEMVESAGSKKAKTELLIRRLARIYTPIVFFLALGIAFIPYFFSENHVFGAWIYRALVFLVISCPCALVISIPLGYFGGIGAASKNGILFKGANYLELMTKLTHVVMDKTGTLTSGVFEVQSIQL